MKKKPYVFLVKAIFVIPLCLFGIWLIQLLYFPIAQATKPETASKPVEEESIFRKILKENGSAPRGHFHMLDELIAQPEPYQPLCFTCHGTFPHSKEKKVRSLLNFHTGFMACAVCHVRKNPDDKKFSFIWINRTTGITSMTVEGEYGKYPAKIFPLRATAQGAEEIIRPVSENSAREYLKLKDKFTPDQAAQAKIKLHERISKKPVFCTECHKKDGYLDFAQLGFPGYRVNHLTSTEVASMIEKYETFYLPEVINFGDN